MVWSLVLLNRATPELINTIFSKEFISSLNIVDEQSIAHKLKLVNIDSAVRYLTPSYTGSTLDIVPEIRNVKLLRTKDKEEMSTSIIECLKNLISEKHFKTKVDSNMGFYFGNVVLVLYYSVLILCLQMLNAILITSVTPCYQRTIRVYLNRESKYSTHIMLHLK